MVKLPHRLLAVIALSGLVFALVNVAKLIPSPAQNVAPPSGNSPAVPDGIPGVSEGSDGSSGSPGSPGSSGASGAGASGSAGPSGVSDSDGTVSSGVNPNEPAFEWTLERMLLATPMPMTQEERDFLSSHPPVEKLRDWNQSQFDDYVSTELGLRQAAQEGYRWRELVVMLQKQQAAAARFLKKKLAKTEIVPASPAGPLDTSSAEQFQSDLKKDTKAGFSKLKQWREEIAVLAGSVESMRKTAEKKGLGTKFSDAVSAAEQ